MPFEFNLNPATPCEPDGFLALPERQIPMTLIRNPRARRYSLRLQSDGSVQVTIPRGRSIAEARRFAGRNVAWLDRALQRRSMRPSHPREWFAGTEIHLRGEPVTIETGFNGTSGQIRFGSEVMKVTDAAADLRRVIERHLWKLATRRGRIILWDVFPRWSLRSQPWADLLYPIRAIHSPGETCPKVGESSPPKAGRAS